MSTQWRNGNWSTVVHYPDRVTGSPWWFRLSCGNGGRGPLCPTDGFVVSDDTRHVTCKACRRTKLYRNAQATQQPPPSGEARP